MVRMSNGAGPAPLVYTVPESIWIVVSRHRTGSPRRSRSDRCARGRRSAARWRGVVEVSHHHDMLNSVAAQRLIHRLDPVGLRGALLDAARGVATGLVTCRARTTH